MCTSKLSFTKENEIIGLTKEVTDLMIQAAVAAEVAKQVNAGMTLKCNTLTRDLVDFRSRFGCLLESRLLFDSTVEVDGRDIRAHKCILAST